MMILSGQVTYQKARKELPSEWLQASRAAGGRVSFAAFSEDSLEDDAAVSPDSLTSPALSPWVFAQEKDRLSQKISIMEDSLADLHGQLSSSKSELHLAKDALDKKEQENDFVV